MRSMLVVQHSTPAGGTPSGLAVVAVVGCYLPACPPAAKGEGRGRAKPPVSNGLINLPSSFSSPPLPLPPSPPPVLYGTGGEFTDLAEDALVSLLNREGSFCVFHRPGHKCRRNFPAKERGKRGRLLWEREGGILAFPPSATSLTNVGWHWVRRIGYEEGAAGKELEKLQGQGG